MKDFIYRCQKLDEDIKLAEAEVNTAGAKILKGKLKQMEHALKHHTVSNCIRIDTMASRKTHKSQNCPKSPKSPRSHLGDDIPHSTNSQDEDEDTTRALPMPNRSRQKKETVIDLAERPLSIEFLQNSLLNLNVTAETKKKDFERSETIFPSRISLLKRQQQLAAARARRKERKAGLL